MPDAITQFPAGHSVKTADRVPNWLRATLGDISAVDVEKPISGTKVSGYHALTNKYAQASQAEAFGNLKASDVYAFVGAVLSMYMKDDAPNDPFGSMMVLEGERSPTTADFLGKSDVLACIADRSSHALVKARCADLAWLLDRRRSAYVQIAIDAYVAAVRDISSGTLEFDFAPERKEQHPDVRKLITRALQIARGAWKQKVRIEELHDFTKQLFDKAIEAGWVVGALWYGRLLSEANVTPPSIIATRLEEFSRRSDVQTWIHLTVETWKLIAQCYHLAGMKADEQRCLGEAAEALVGHALDQSHTAMVRAHFLSDAIVQLQGLPGKRERRNAIKLLLREAPGLFNALDYAGF